MRGNERGGLQRNSNGAGIISAAEHFCRNPTESERPRWERTRGSPAAPGAAPAPPGPRAPAPGAAAAPPVRGSRRQRLQPPRPAEPLLLVFSTCWLTSRYSEYFPGVVPAREGLPQLPWGCNDSAGGMPARGGEAGEKFGGRLARCPAGHMSGQGDTRAGRREEGMSRRESGARGGRWDGEGAATTPAVPRRARQAALLAQRPHSLPSLPLCILASFPPCLLPSPRRQRRAVGAPQAGSGAPAGGGEPGAKGRAGAGGKRPRPGAPLSPRAPATSRRGPRGEGRRLGGCRSLPKPASASEAAWQRAGRGEVHVG